MWGVVSEQREQQVQRPDPWMVRTDSWTPAPAGQGRLGPAPEGLRAGEFEPSRCM